MDKNSTNYVLIFVLIMTVVVAFSLASIRQVESGKALITKTLEELDNL